MRKPLFSFLMMTLSLTVFANGKIAVEDYINTYKDIAVAEMRRTGIPASITLGQGILESAFGNSDLARKANNHFGIKCHKEWNGRRFYMDDDKRNECFRVYRNAEASYYDHSDFLMTRERYASLFNLRSTDYKGWAHGLKKAGYATNPKYAHILIDLIERHDLHIYDKGFSKREVVQHVNTKTKPSVPEKVERSTKVTLREPIEAVTLVNSQRIFKFNNINAVKVKSEEGLVSLASDFGLTTKQIAKYNDLEISDRVIVGEIIYLKPKKRKTDQRIHIVQNNETLWKISQLYGLRLNALLKRNRLETGQEVAHGQKLFLNSKAPYAPRIRKMGDTYVQPEENPNELEIEVAPVVNNSRKEQKAKEIEKEQAVDYVEPVMPNQQNSSTIGHETASNDPPPGGGKRGHIVKKGDTLYSIARRYNVSVNDLLRWNNLSDNTINLDSVLIVSP